MTDINEIITTVGPRLREAVSNFLVPLLTTRVVKKDAFEELAASAEMLAKLLKGHDLVPKSLLREIYGSIGSLRNEAPYFKEQSATLVDMSNKLEWTYYLILIGECNEDRVPGVPRII